MLLSRIRSIHQRSYGAYGAPRIHAELKRVGHTAVGLKRVARLMHMASISGVSRRRAVRTTWRSEEGRKAYRIWSTGTSPLRPGTGCG